MNRTVLVSVPATAVPMKAAALFLLSFCRAGNSSPATTPMRIRGIKQAAMVAKGFSENSVAPNTSPIKHLARLDAPNTPPKKPPRAGPRVMPPITTGITIKVIATGPTYR